jgi:hypothetical protein
MKCAGMRRVAAGAADATDAAASGVAAACGA